MELPARSFWSRLTEAAARNGPLLAIVVPAILYLAGSLYLRSYYIRLGLPASELSFDVPEVLRASLNVVRMPVFWLAAAASVCLLAAHLAGRTPASLFDPIPTPQAVAAVLLVWATKATIDFTHPATPVDWLFGRRRDVLFFGLGALVLAGLHYGAMQGRKRPLLEPATRSLLLLQVFVGLLVGWQVAMFGRWPHSWALTAGLGAFAAYTLCEALRQLLRWRRTARPTVRLAQEVGSPATNPGISLFVSLMAAFAFLFAAALAGAAAGKAVSTVCAASRVVSFDPSPPRISENHTYFLTLHDNGHYYLRENGTGKVVIVPDNPSVVVTLSWPKRSVAC